MLENGRLKVEVGAKFGADFSKSSDLVSVPELLLPMSLKMNFYQNPSPTASMGRRQTFFRNLVCRRPMLAVSHGF